MTDSNNVGYGYDATVEENMAAFDRLPKCVREALRYADTNWSSQQCYLIWKKKGWVTLAGNVIQAPTAQSVVELIKKADARNK
jgi:hypothetical protein